MTRTTRTRRRAAVPARQRGRATSALRERDRGARPARRSAALTAVRGDPRRFQRRLPRAYSRFDDGHPGRRQIGSGGWADRGWHSNNGSPFLGSCPGGLPKAPRRHPGSTIHAALRACSSASSLLCRPALDLGTQPELDSSVAEVDDRAWHIVISTLIQANAVAMRKAERISNSLRVHQVFRGYEWCHPDKATSVDGSVRSEL